MMATGRLPILDALRGIASLGVALFHMSIHFSSSVPQLIHSIGWLGVDMFFVISGFVIPYSLADRRYRVRDFPRFIIRRLVRLEPPYLISIALVLILWHLSNLAPGYRGNPPEYSLPQLLSHLLYFTGPLGYKFINDVYWTLGYEFSYYLFVGLSFPFLATRSASWTAMIVIVAVIIFHHFSPLREARDVCLLEFGLGQMLMRVTTGKGRNDQEIFWCIGFLTAIFYFGGSLVGTAVLATTLAIYFCPMMEIGWAKFLGRLSYSLYLIHIPISSRIINLATRFAGGTPQWDLVILGSACGITIFISHIYAKLIEQPAIRASQKIRIAAEGSERT